MESWEFIEIDVDAIIADAREAANDFFAVKSRLHRDAHFTGWAQTVAHMPMPLQDIAAAAFADRFGDLAKQN
jgi:hypothetical protein